VAYAAHRVELTPLPYSQTAATAIKSIWGKSAHKVRNLVSIHATKAKIKANIKANINNHLVQG